MKKIIWIIVILAALFPTVGLAQANLNAPGISINFGQGANLVDTMQIMVLFTLLSLAPSFIILCTSFTRIIVGRMVIHNISSLHFLVKETRHP